jgi:hypothetical protein
VHVGMVHDSAREVTELLRVGKLSIEKKKRSLEECGFRCEVLNGVASVTELTLLTWRRRRVCSTNLIRALLATGVVEWYRR